MNSDALFIEQVNEMKFALLRNEYIEIEKYIKAKYDVVDNGEWTEENLIEIALYGSYIAGVMRNVYINYVYRRGYDGRAYWDACIMALLMGLIWNPIFEEYFSDKDLKKAINKTSFPEWTKIGIAGGSWSKIQKMLMDFSESV